MKNGSRLAVLILPAFLLGASGCMPAPTACPAVGFVNLGPVQLDLSDLPNVSSVSACFGVDDRCNPVPVSRDNSGRWLVPQTQPFVQPDTAPIPLPRIRVVAVTDQSISDRLYGVARTPPRGGCDNTYDLTPVKVTAPGG